MKFSIIVPVYNAEKYLSTTLESIINQSVNFETSTEIILVDDGSTDQSSTICQQYKEKHPDNIKYIYTENSGPGNARNVGINMISSDSDITGFIDADDYISKNTLESVQNFFEQHTRVKLAVIPLYHFEEIDTPHRLNHRFSEGDRVINILEEYKSIHFHIGGCFFRSEYFKDEDVRFRTDLRFWEDALLINSFLLKNKEYGVVSAPSYYYRKRTENDSLVNKAWYQKERYTDVIQDCYNTLITDSIERYNKIIPYVQFLLIYHSRLFLAKKNNSIIFDVLDPSELDEFFREFTALIQQIDVKYIMEQDMPKYYKLFLQFIKKNGWVFNKPITEFNHQISLSNWKFEGKRNYITYQYRNTSYMTKINDRFFAMIDNNRVYASESTKSKVIWGINVAKNHTFTIEVPKRSFNYQIGLETNQGTYLFPKVKISSYFVNLIKRFAKKLLGK